MLCGSERQYWIHPALAMWLIVLPRDPRFEVSIEAVMNKRPVDYARNYSIELARTGHFDWLLLLDADQSFASNPLDVLTQCGDKRIIGIPSAFVNLGPGQPIHANTSGVLSQSGEFVEFRAVGSGVLFIHSSVWQSIEQPLFAAKYKGLGEIDVPEDFAFCDLARAHGFRVWATVQTAHHFHTTDTTGQAAALHAALQRAR